MSGYNYERFDEYVESGLDATEFADFANRNHAGERAPDGEVRRLDDGTIVRLSDVWKTQDVILEFGSFT